MYFVSFIRWWYGIGWRDQLTHVRRRLDATADYFSLELALRTFFRPFRQIDAERARKGSLDVILRAAFDQLFSRLIGSFARLFLLIIGSIGIGLSFVFGGLRLVLWPLIPLLPLFALPLFSSGWVPWL